MANECLQTKLKSVVDNDNLEYLNCITFNRKSDISGDTIGFKAKAGSTITVDIIKGTGAISKERNYSDNLQHLEYVITNAGAMNYIRCKAGDYIINVSSKNDITYFYTESASIDIDSLQYVPLTYLACINTQSRGDIANLVKVNKELNAVIVKFNTNITGNINSLGGNTSLSEIRLSETSITGSIEGLVAAQMAAGRTTVPDSEPIYIEWTMIQIPLGNKYNTETGNSKLCWNASGQIIVFLGDDFASATKMYVYGYTQSEIDTNVASGGVWYGKTVVKCD